MQSVPEDVHHHLYRRREEVHELAGELQNDSWTEAVKVASSFLVIQENISRRKSDALDIDLADLQEVREEEFVTVSANERIHFLATSFVQRKKVLAVSMTTYCRIVAAMCPCSPKPRTS